MRFFISGQGPYMKLAEDAWFDPIDTPTVPKAKVFEEFGKTLGSVFFDEDNFEYYFSQEDSLLRNHKPDIIIRDHFREFAGVAVKQPPLTCL